MLLWCRYLSEYIRQQIKDRPAYRIQLAIYKTPSAVKGDEGQHMHWNHPCDKIFEFPGWGAIVEALNGFHVLERCYNLTLWVYVTRYVVALILQSIAINTVLTICFLF